MKSRKCFVLVILIVTLLQTEARDNLYEEEKYHKTTPGVFKNKVSKYNKKNSDISEEYEGTKSYDIQVKLHKHSHEDAEDATSEEDKLPLKDKPSFVSSSQNVTLKLLEENMKEINKAIKKSEMEQEEEEHKELKDRLWFKCEACLQKMMEGKYRPSKKCTHQSFQNQEKNKEINDINHTRKGSRSKHDVKQNKGVSLPTSKETNTKGVKLVKIRIARDMLPNTNDKTSHNCKKTKSQDHNIAKRDLAMMPAEHGHRSHTRYENPIILKLNEKRTSYHPKHNRSKHVEKTNSAMQASEIIEDIQPADMQVHAPTRILRNVTIESSTPNVFVKVDQGRVPRLEINISNLSNTSLHCNATTNQNCSNEKKTIRIIGYPPYRRYHPLADRIRGLAKLRQRNRIQQTETKKPTSESIQQGRNATAKRKAIKKIIIINENGDEVVLLPISQRRQYNHTQYHKKVNNSTTQPRRRIIYSKTRQQIRKDGHWKYHHNHEENKTKPKKDEFTSKKTKIASRKNKFDQSIESTDLAKTILSEFNLKDRIDTSEVSDELYPTKAIPQVKEKFSSHEHYTTEKGIHSHSAIKKSPELEMKQSPTSKIEINFVQSGTEPKNETHPEANNEEDTIVNGTAVLNKIKYVDENGHIIAKSQYMEGDKPFKKQDGKILVREYIKTYKINKGDIVEDKSNEDNNFSKLIELQNVTKVESYQYPKELEANISSNPEIKVVNETDTLNVPTFETSPQLEESFKYDTSTNKTEEVTQVLSETTEPAETLVQEKESVVLNSTEASVTMDNCTMTNEEDMNKCNRTIRENFNNTETQTQSGHELNKNDTREFNNTTTETPKCNHDEKLNNLDSTNITKLEEIDQTTIKQQEKLDIETMEKLVDEHSTEPKSEKRISKETFSEQPKKENYDIHPKEKIQKIEQVLHKTESEQAKLVGDPLEKEVINQDDIKNISEYILDKSKPKFNKTIKKIHNDEPQEEKNSFVKCPHHKAQTDAEDIHTDDSYQTYDDADILESLYDLTDKYFQEYEPVEKTSHHKTKRSADENKAEKFVTHNESQITVEPIVKINAVKKDYVTEASSMDKFNQTISSRKNLDNIADIKHTVKSLIDKDLTTKPTNAGEESDIKGKPKRQTNEPPSTSEIEPEQETTQTKRQDHKIRKLPFQAPDHHQESQLLSNGSEKIKGPIIEVILHIEPQVLYSLTKAEKVSKPAKPKYSKIKKTYKNVENYRRVGSSEEHEITKTHESHEVEKRSPILLSDLGQPIILRDLIMEHAPRTQFLKVQRASTSKNKSHKRK